MAKSKKKDKASKKALSGGSLFSQEAVSQFLLNRSGRLPDMDLTLRKAGIARNLLSVVLEDDEVAQTSETRLDALLSQPYRLEPSDAPETKYLQQEINQWFSAIATCGLDALWYGYSVQEAVYEQKEDGYLGFKDVKQKALQWFEPKNDGRLIYRQDGVGLEQEVDQYFKFFLTVRKSTYENPYGKPLLSTLYWLWFFKQNGFKFWAKCLERFGTPILLGKADSSEPQEMLEALLNAHAQSVISVDKDDDVQVLNSAGGGSQGQAFDLFNNAIIRQIQKVVLGQTLTSGNDGGGSRALGEVHENVRKDKLKSDIRLITPTFQTVVNALCQLNGWQYHKIIIGDERSLNKDQAERDEILSRTGLTFSKEYFKNTYGLKDTDIEIKKVEPTQTQFTAITPKAYQFTANNHLSPEQQQVEQITDQQPPMQLLPQDKIAELVQMSASPQELTQHLIGLLPDVSQQTFTANLDRALFTADVMGFVHSAKE